MLDIEVTDKNILEIIRKAKTFEVSPREAEKQSSEYMLSDKSVPIGEYFRRVSLWEKITTEAYPLNEIYVEKHNLSGRLTT
jgi:hypothetical protein